MISIKKYLDHRGGAPISETPEKFLTVVDAYRSGLAAISKATSLDGSPHGVEAGNRLRDISERIGAKPGAEDIKQAANEVDANLALWSWRVVSDRQALLAELKELVLALAKTADAVGSRSKDH